MAAALPFLPYISAAVSAIGAIQQGNAAGAQNEQQAAMARYNAQVSANQAEQARRVSAAEQEAQARKSRAALGMTSAAIAQSGTGFGGSNADILDQTRTLSELDQLNQAYEGQVRAQGFVTQAEIERFQADIYTRNASRARTAGYLGAGKSILSGASSIFGTSPAATQRPSASLGYGLSLDRSYGTGFTFGGRRYG